MKDVGSPKLRQVHIIQEKFKSYNSSSYIEDGYSNMFYTQK